jgi:hypothetical protein
VFRPVLRHEVDEGGSRVWLVKYASRP